MVGSNSQLPHIEVRVKMINCFDNSQKFTPGRAIVTLWFALSLAVIGYYSFVPLVNLRENSTNTNIAGTHI